MKRIQESQLELLTSTAEKTRVELNTEIESLKDSLEAEKVSLDQAQSASIAELVCVN
jgi:hypothetical protein